MHSYFMKILYKVKLPEKKWEATQGSNRVEIAPWTKWPGNKFVFGLTYWKYVKALASLLINSEDSVYPCHKRSRLFGNGEQKILRKFKDKRHGRSEPALPIAPGRNSCLVCLSASTAFCIAWHGIFWHRRLLQVWRDKRVEGMSGSGSYDNRLRTHVAKCRVLGFHKGLSSPITRFLISNMACFFLLPW